MSDKLYDRMSQRPDLTKLVKNAALVASVAVAHDNAVGAADLVYDSGSITSDNVVGWFNSILQEQTFAINVTGSRNFFVKTDVLAGSDVGVARGLLAAATFRVGTYTGNRSVSAPLQLFSSGQTFNEGAGATFLGLGGFISNSNVYGSLPNEVNGYLLYKFEDAGTPYYGWIDVDIRAGKDGEALENYIRINRYAWQSSTLGILPAGVTPVPEPSTLVTSGIAALAGGAVALRRWRKERKAKTEAA